MIIILLTILLPQFENISHEVTIFENDTNYFILYIDRAACVACYRQIDSLIKQMNNKNFKYYVLIKSERSVISRKRLINWYKNDLNPDLFIFNQDNDSFEEYLKVNQIEYTPAIFTLNRGNIHLHSYKNIFHKKSIEIISNILQEINK